VLERWDCSPAIVRSVLESPTAGGGSLSSTERSIAAWNAPRTNHAREFRHAMSTAKLEHNCELMVRLLCFALLGSLPEPRRVPPMNHS